MDTRYACRPNANSTKIKENGDIVLKANAIYLGENCMSLKDDKNPESHHKNKHAKKLNIPNSTNM